MPSGKEKEKTATVKGHADKGNGKEGESYQTLAF